ncbi:MAG: tyrosine-type recombinase/integrase [Myxococcaceae bacterium]
MSTPTLGAILHSFFIDHLKVAKGLRPSSISSYRDGLRLYLLFVAKDVRRAITKLSLADLTAQRVLNFLRSLEEHRGNRIQTRNQRLAILRTFFEYLGGRVPELLMEAEKVARIPTKRTAPPPTHYLERDEIEALFARLRSDTWRDERDATLLVFLYNTGARAQEVANLRVAHLDLGAQPQVRLHGKGDKWRNCPLWLRTAGRLRRLLDRSPSQPTPDTPVFRSRRGQPLTRFGIYKIVRRRASYLDGQRASHGRVTPHVLRHTTAVHLLDAGVEVNVIRGWLGHAQLETTNRYAEISRRTKEVALRAVQPPTDTELPRRPPWRNDRTLLEWLDSL